MDNAYEIKKMLENEFAGDSGITEKMSKSGLRNPIYPKSKLEVVVTSWALLSTSEQLDLLKDTDILFGFGGTDMINTMFMPRISAVIIPWKQERGMYRYSDDMYIWFGHKPYQTLKEFEVYVSGRIGNQTNHVYKHNTFVVSPSKRYERPLTDDKRHNPSIGPYYGDGGAWWQYNLTNADDSEFVKSERKMSAKADGMWNIDEETLGNLRESGENNENSESAEENQPLLKIKPFKRIAPYFRAGIQDPNSYPWPNALSEKAVKSKVLTIAKLRMIKEKQSIKTVWLDADERIKGFVRNAFLNFREFGVKFKEEIET